ncbi:MAG: amidohydrolase family protein [Nanoarchaeota archaeon]|nr:amidohydrolase family protein [Nanoarchaeota archaeon]
MLLIKNARLLENGTPVTRHIYVANGKIKKFLRPSDKKSVNADKVIDAKNNYVLPGLIDAHVHFREPGMVHKEDFLSGSKAAAAGGVTTFIEMPNTKPPTLTVKELHEKRMLAKKSIVDYGFHFGSSTDNLSEIKKVWQNEHNRIASTKVFMNISTGKMLIEDDVLLKKIFSASKMITVHAEGKKIEKAVEMSNCANRKLHLLHISLASEMDFIKKTKKASKYTVEVTPHHLFLTERFVKDRKNLKAIGKMFPSLKTQKDRMALWNGIYKGFVDTIGTDHAPHTIEEKSVDFDKAPGGVPGIETMLPLLLDQVNKCNLTLTQTVNLTSTNPAKIFGIKNKGSMSVGHDADLVIVDLKKTKKVKNEELFTKCKWSPFDGLSLKGWPITTIVRGNVVFDGENVICDKLISKNKNHRGGEIEFNH